MFALQNNTHFALSTLALIGNLLLAQPNFTVITVLSFDRTEIIQKLNGGML